MAEWISVKDKLPVQGQDVLLLRYFCGEWTAYIGWWNGEEWDVYDIEAAPCYCATIDNVQYWLPIPDPPKDS